jgi:hypothetical protein
VGKDRGRQARGRTDLVDLGVAESVLFFVVKHHTVLYKVMKKVSYKQGSTCQLLSSQRTSSMKLLSGTVQGGLLRNCTM